VHCATIITVPTNEPQTAQPLAVIRPLFTTDLVFQQNLAEV